jgi:hypothetical protein
MFAGEVPSPPLAAAAAAAGRSCDQEQALVPELTGPSDEGIDDDSESVHEQEGTALEEDLYGFAITSLLRDTWRLVSGTGNRCARAGRLATTLMLINLTFAMSAFLVYSMKRWVTPHTVLEVRALYDRYELWMYANHTHLTVNGFNRGISEYYQLERFSSLDEEVQSRICGVPLGHPNYCTIILFIWTLTVVADIRRAGNLADLFLRQVPTVPQVQDMFELRDGRAARDHDGKVRLEGVPWFLKAVLLIVLIVPRVALDTVLLWLGCRWLIATTCMENILLNAVALEFILCFKDLLYLGAVPVRNWLETQEMLIGHNTKQTANCRSYLGEFAWLLVALSWVLAYIFYFQQVLPDYKWDIRAACALTH